MKFEKGTHVGFVADIDPARRVEVREIKYTVTNRTVKFSQRLSAFSYRSVVDRTTYYESRLRQRVGDSGLEALRGAVAQHESDLAAAETAWRLEKADYERNIKALRSALAGKAV